MNQAEREARRWRNRACQLQEALNQLRKEHGCWCDEYQRTMQHSAVCQQVRYALGESNKSISGRSDHAAYIVLPKEYAKTREHD